MKKRKRPTKLHGITVRSRVGCGNLYVTINEDKYGPCEIFITLGKAGGCIGGLTNSLGRILSVALRSGTNIDDLLTQLDGQKCPLSVDKKPIVLSCQQGVADAIIKYLTYRRRQEPERRYKVLRDRASNTPIRATDDICRWPVCRRYKYE